MDGKTLRHECESGELQSFNWLEHHADNALLFCTFCGSREVPHKSYKGGRNTTCVCARTGAKARWPQLRPTGHRGPEATSKASDHLCEGEPPEAARSRGSRDLVELELELHAAHVSVPVLGSRSGRPPLAGGIARLGVGDVWRLLLQIAGAYWH